MKHQAFAAPQLFDPQLVVLALRFGLDAALVEQRWRSWEPMKHRKKSVIVEQFNATAHPGGCGTTTIIHISDED